MIDFVCVLTGTVFAIQQWMIVEWFIFQYFDAFAAARLIFRYLGNGI